MMISSEISRWEQYGLYHGIMSVIKSEVELKGFDLKDFIGKYDFNGSTIHQLELKVIIPTSSDLHKIVCEVPHFHYYNHWGYIDMLYVDDELQFHFMEVKDGELVNCGWHTVREGLTIEETRLLFEYVMQMRHKLIVVPHEMNDAFDKSGALDIYCLDDVPF